MCLFDADRIGKHVIPLQKQALAVANFKIAEAVI